MATTIHGVADDRLELSIRLGASHLGIDPYEYRRKVEAGLKWCSLDQDWEPRERFGPNVNRADGLHTSCRESHRDYARAAMAKLRKRRAS